MGEEIRKAYAIPSKYLTKNDEIETYYRCSACNMSVSKEQKYCEGCYRIILWK